VGDVAPPTDSAPVIVDINQAVVAELEQLPGIGPATAAAIVVERDRNGPFLDVEELQRVPGIGPAKMDLLRELVAT
jgi:competence protein ComEA